MTDVVWKDPPPSKSGTKRWGMWREFVKELQHNPGRWAVAAPSAPNHVHPAQALCERYGCEVATRKNDDGTFTHFARWVNDPEGVAVVEAVRKWEQQHPRP